MSSEYRGLSSLPDLPPPQMKVGGLPLFTLTYNNKSLPVPAEQYDVWAGADGEWKSEITPGIYDEENGKISRTYKFYDGEEGEVFSFGSSFVLPTSLVGKYIVADEVTIRGVHRVETMVGRYAFVREGLPNPPVFNNINTVRSTSATPPFSLFSNHPLNGSFTGELIETQEAVWVVNGEEVGGAVANVPLTLTWGDRAFVRRRATNIFGVTTTSDSKEAVYNKDWFDLWKASGDEVKALQDASPGLRPACERFQVVDHVNGVYEWNDNLWLSGEDFRRQLSAVKVATFANDTNYIDGTNWSESFGGVLITPRHVLTARHAYYGGNSPFGPNITTPWALPLSYTPGTYPLRKYRFLLPDNTTYETRLIADCNPTFILPVGHPLYNVELAIGLLEEDVPAGLGILPLAYPNFRVVEPNIEETVLTDTGISQGYLVPSFFATLFISQAEGRILSPNEEGPPWEGSAMPLNGANQKSMVTCHNPRAFTTPSGGSLNLSSHYSKFFYKAWSGDSSCPQLHLFGNQLYVATMAVNSQFGRVGGPNPGDYPDLINDLILWAERRAEVQNPTLFKGYSGYRVRAATLEELADGPTPEWWLPGN
jgi:hypothetical protein